jgi:hypothetical protein
MGTAISNLIGVTQKKKQGRNSAIRSLVSSTPLPQQQTKPHFILPELKPETGFKAGLKNLFGIFKPSNIKDTAKNVASDVRRDPVGALEAIPKGLFDTFSRIDNNITGLNEKAINAISPFKDIYVNRLPVFSEQYDQLVHPGKAETDTSKALRESATNVAGFELGNSLFKGLGYTNRFLNTIGGNVAGGQLTTEAETIRDRLKQAGSDAIFGLVTESLGTVLRSLKRADVPIYENGVVQVVPKNPKAPKSYYTIPEQDAATVINKLDNGVDQAGNSYHISTAPPARLDVQGFVNKGVVDSKSIPTKLTRGLSSGVEIKAIENKLTKGFGDLPEYSRINMKEQAVLSQHLIDTDIDKATRIAMGQEPAPQHILPESVFTAVENHAIKTKNVELLRRLATESQLTSEATAMGQRIRALADRNPNSPTGAIQQVVRAREAAIARKIGNVSKAKATIKEAISDELKKSAPRPKDWAEFVEKLKCT